MYAALIERRTRGNWTCAYSRPQDFIFSTLRALDMTPPLTTPGVDLELLARLADLYSKDDWFSARLSKAVHSEKPSDQLAEDAGAATPMTQHCDASAKPGVDRMSTAARMAASVMRSDGGAEIAVIEATGWDTHANQGAAKGALAGRLRELDSALRARSDELRPLGHQTAVLVVTEFGRTGRP